MKKFWIGILGFLLIAQIFCVSACDFPFSVSKNSVPPCHETSSQPSGCKCESMQMLKWEKEEPQFQVVFLGELIPFFISSKKFFASPQFSTISFQTDPVIIPAFSILLFKQTLLI